MNVEVNLLLRAAGMLVINVRDETNIREVVCCAAFARIEARETLSPSLCTTTICGRLKARSQGLPPKTQFR